MSSSNRELTLIACKLVRENKFSDLIVLYAKYGKLFDLRAIASVLVYGEAKHFETPEKAISCLFALSGQLRRQIIETIKKQFPKGEVEKLNKVLDFDGLVKVIEEHEDHFLASFEYRAAKKARRNLFELIASGQHRQAGELAFMCPYIDNIEVALCYANAGYFKTPEKALETLAAIPDETLRAEIPTIIDNPNDHGLMGKLDFLLTPLLLPVRAKEAAKDAKEVAVKAKEGAKDSKISALNGANGQISAARSARLFRVPNPGKKPSTSAPVLVTPPSARL